MESSLRTPSWGRPLIAVNALAAWFGVLLSAYLSVSGYYLGKEDPAKVSILGNVPSGHDQWYERLFDWLTYFTIWSNIVVAVVLTVLWLRPGVFARRDGTGFVWRALRLDSVLMIVITGIVYNLVLATGGKTGADLVSDTTLHVVVPVLTLVVWLLAGPRGLLDLRVIAASLVLPIGWAAMALVRGAVVGAYPYPFLDVAKNGFASVLAFVGVILVVAVVLALVLLGLDRVLPPRPEGRESTA
ncbi:MAG TPA: Pr6Pr family membrane protein [Candidatus Nanopelagicales bacterium]|nr:Pr6Pr family membrane protein [Candidatus Nanopelagicales bacterium]